MTPFSFSRIITDNDEDAAVLDQWIEEREIDKILRCRSDEPLPFVVDASRLAKAGSPFDEHVESGQIRILSSSLVADDTVIPYVAVLERWIEDIWLIAPFSQYATPATDGEMATGIPLVGQRVIQCWNARGAHERLIGESHVMGTLDDKVRNEALALFHHVCAGKDLPDDFSALVGPPILTKADPRREYIVESASRYAPLTEATIKLESMLALAERIAKNKSELLRSAMFVRSPIAAFSQQALAAGDKTNEPSETFIAPAFGGEIVVKYAPSEGKTRIVVYNQNGMRDSQTLEGFAIVDKDGVPVGMIENGLLVVAASSITEQFLILHPETLKPVDLKVKGN
jgi:hypothetical protein